MDKKATLQELLTAFATKSGLPRRRAEAFVRAFFDVIADALASEKFVRVKGLGTFKLVAVSERESVDVNTGERIQISGHTKVSFTPEAGLRDLINRPFAHFQTVVINEGTDLNALEAVDTPDLTPGSETPDDAETTFSKEGTDTTTDIASPEAAEETDEPTFLPPSAMDYVAEYLLDEADEDADATSDTTQPVPEAEERPDEQAESTTSLPRSAQQPEPPTEAAAITTEEDEISPTSTPVPSDETTETPSAGTLRQEAAPPTPTPAGEDAPTAAGTIPTDTAQHKPAQDQPDAATDTANNKPAASATPPTRPSDANEHPEAATPPLPQPPAPQPPAPRDVNWWKVTVVVIGILFLMMLSYFAGYFRLFCPCERLDALHRLWTEQAAPPAPAAPATPVPADTLRPAAAPRDTAALPADTVAPTPPAPAATSPAASGAQPTARPAPQEKQPQTDTQTRKKNTQATTQRRKRTAPRHQKYIITGTRDTYVVSQGETLRTIAEHVYGSRGYARYIIEHNHITHPDDIPAGLTIRLPELEPNPDYRPR